MTITFDAAATIRAAMADIERLREGLIHADMKIRSLPHTDQSDVEFIRAALDTRLAAAEAERDAAVARAEAAIAWNGITSELEKISIRSEAFAEGERRATAALVDWLRSRGDCQSADDEIAAWLQLQKGTPNE